MKNIFRKFICCSGTEPHAQCVFTCVCNVNMKNTSVTTGATTHVVTGSTPSATTGATTGAKTWSLFNNKRCKEKSSCVFTCFCYTGFRQVQNERDPLTKPSAIISRRYNGRRRSSTPAPVVPAPAASLLTTIDLFQLPAEPVANVTSGSSVILCLPFPDLSTVTSEDLYQVTSLSSFNSFQVGCTIPVK